MTLNPRHSLPGIALASIVSLAFLAACGDSPGTEQRHGAQTLDTTAQPKPQFGAKATQLWQGVVRNTLANGELQPGCEPTRLSPPTGTPYRGVVILYHGYTACPQQYFEWDEDLRKAGFEVLIPLLPGQGRVPESMSPRKDITFQIPTLSTQFRYTELVDAMNAVAEAAGGDRMVGGLSVGGAVSLQATQRKPGLYKRQILFSPFFAISGKIASLIPSLVGISDLPVKILQLNFAESQIGWGPDCEVKETKRGRAGICQFQAKHLAGAAAFGAKVSGAAAPGSAITQIVGVENDSAAHVGKTVEVAKKMGGGAGRVSLCLYPASVPHSMLSRFDGDERKPWLDGLKSQATRFLTAPDAPAFDGAGQSAVAGIPRCR